MSLDSTKRFSDRVENYIKYRPGYPKEILSYLEEEFGFNSKMQVVDIGSGTGILTKLFLEHGNTVYAVEPNDAMRNAAEDLLKKYSRFISIHGTAEQTGLHNDSVDMIVAGQAFHWFDPVKTKKEFQRIAKINSHVVLIWNERQVKSGFEKAYEMFLMQYATDYKEVKHTNITAGKIEAFYHPHLSTHKTFYNEQIFDFDGLKGRLLSSSYVPNTNHPLYKEMIIALQHLFDKYQDKGKVKIEYETSVYVGEISRGSFFNFQPIAR